MKMGRSYKFDDVSYVRISERISKREKKRFEEKVQQEKFENECNKLIFGFRLMYFTTIIIEYFILRWWFK